MRDDSSPFRGLFVALFISLVVVFLVFAISSGHAPELTREQIRECQRYWERDEYCGALVSPPAKILIVDWIANNTDWLAALITASATVFIALFTRALKRSTDNLWVATKAAADAAKESADAIPVIERAYVFLKLEKDNLSECLAHALGTTTDVYVSGPPKPFIAWRLHNGGRTTAVIADIRMAIEIADAPSEPPYENLPSVEYRDEFIHSTNLTEENAIKRDRISRGQALEIASPEGGKSIFFCGEIDYEDVLDKPRRTGFCLRWRHSEGGFEPYGGKKYNYRK